MPHWRHLQSRRELCYSPGACACMQVEHAKQAYDMSTTTHKRPPKAQKLFARCPWQHDGAHKQSNKQSPRRENMVHTNRSFNFSTFSKRCFAAADSSSAALALLSSNCNTTKSNSPTTWKDSAAPLPSRLHPMKPRCRDCFLLRRKNMISEQQQLATTRRPGGRKFNWKSEWPWMSP